MPKILKKLRWINVFIIFLTFLSYLSPYINPHYFWPISLLGLIYPWLLAANIILVLIWAILKKKYFLYSLACILLGWGALTSLVGFRFTEPLSLENQLKVISLNTHALIDVENNKQFVDKERLSNYLRHLGADIYCFQEFKNNRIKKNIQNLGNYLAEEHQLEYYSFEVGGSLAIYSKYPIEQHEVKYFANRANGYMYADINIHDQIIRIYNIHLQSNKVASLTEKMDKISNLQKKKTWSHFKKIFQLYVKGTQARVDQTREIANHIKNCPYPVVVCGDFNDPPQSYSFHTLSRGLVDTFKERGKGLGATYAGNIPGLRIDYILVSPIIKPIDFDIEPCPFSDHHSVIGTVKLPQRN